MSLLLKSLSGADEAKWVKYRSETVQLALLLSFIEGSSHLSECQWDKNILCK